jgi:DNA-binding transcriptional MerR regulator
MVETSDSHDDPIRHVVVLILENHSFDHSRRLCFIRRSRDLGFLIEQVRALLDLADQRDRNCAAVDGIDREHLADVERKIADLKLLRAELLNVIGQCRHGTVAECRFIEALSPA